MKFRVSSELAYEVNFASTLLVTIHALRLPGQTIIEETLTTYPHVRIDELVLPSAEYENRFIRLSVEQGIHLTISYQAVVDTSFRLVAKADLEAVPLMELDSRAIPFLFPSRYCQSDKLGRMAYKKFGHLPNGYDKVLSIVDWIYENIEYVSGSTNSHTSAYDTITERSGVCRDFAHLGIALCRALTIPARYFTGYSYRLKSPDFHACFEAYIGGQWLIFDATRLAPLNGLIKIANGRDAADASIASIFGNVNFSSMHVDCQLLEDNFTPITQDDLYSQGLALGVR